MPQDKRAETDEPKGVDHKLSREDNAKKTGDRPFSGRGPVTKGGRFRSKSRRGVNKRKMRKKRGKRRINRYEKPNVEDEGD